MFKFDPANAVKDVQDVKADLQPAGAAAKVVAGAAGKVVAGAGAVLGVDALGDAVDGLVPLFDTKVELTPADALAAV